MDILSKIINRLHEMARLENHRAYQVPASKKELYRGRAQVLLDAASIIKSMRQEEDKEQ